MNPWDLSASELLIWGIFLHLIADWLFQSEWMASNKSNRRVKKVTYQPIGVSIDVAEPSTNTDWWDRHPAAYIHAGIHGSFLLLVFGWAAIPLAFAHLIIDCRRIVIWWADKIGQTPSTVFMVKNPKTQKQVALMDMGTVVRLWVDQVFHIACVGIAALLVA